MSRIIPARAGQTVLVRFLIACEPDHPRACGANCYAVSQHIHTSGSSPRVRGKRCACRLRDMSHRIIPARAGQTAEGRRRLGLYTDHPRACGANFWSNASSRCSTGSSPRVRGKHKQANGENLTYRIIPARAGQTATAPGIPRLGTDHPRACGANRTATPEKSTSRGSSPRVRGKQSDFMRKLLSAGPSIIGFAQWLQSSCYCSCFQSSAKTPISRGTTPTSLFLGFQNSITLLLLT